MTLLPPEDKTLRNQDTWRPKCHKITSGILSSALTSRLFASSSRPLNLKLSSSFHLLPGYSILGQPGEAVLSCRLLNCFLLLILDNPRKLFRPTGCSSASLGSIYNSTNLKLSNWPIVPQAGSRAFLRAVFAPGRNRHWVNSARR